MGKGHNSQLKGHEFTPFEIQVALCLMCKGEHLLGPQYDKKGEAIQYDNKHKKDVYTTFATRMNETLHGQNYAKDISKREITALIDRLTVEHKSVFGRYGYLERSGQRRLTRSINRVFHSNRKQNYDGSKQEWVMGRKAMVENELRREKGLLSVEEEAARKQALAEEIRVREEREAADIEEQLAAYRAEMEKEKEKEKQNAQSASTSLPKDLLPITESSGTQPSNAVSTTAGSGTNESISASVLHGLLPITETTNTQQRPRTKTPRKDVRRDEYGRPLSKPKVRANNSRLH